MRRGKFEEGEAVLRMKGDLSSPMPCMWDLVAYRIKYTVILVGFFLLEAGMLKR